MMNQWKISKRFLAISLAALTLAAYSSTALPQYTGTAFSLKVSAAVDEDDFEYEENNNLLTITGYTGEAADLVIPKYIKGKKVKYIGDSAFEACPYIERVTLPNTVVSIGEGAFYNCTSLEEINIPEKVTKIKEEAFYNTALTEIIIPNSVKILGAGAFNNCSELETVTLSKNITVINDSTFENCISLTNITVPYGVTKLGDSAFANCCELTGISLPVSITKMGESVFEDCENLKAITIPKKVTVIRESAFSYCTSLKNIKIPENVKTIESRAFANCDNLVTVKIPKATTQIDYSSFIWCENLQNIFVDTENTAYSSKNGVLFNKAKTSLLHYPEGKPDTSYTLPSTVKTIGKQAFVNSQNLAKVILNNRMTEIGEGAFYRCAHLSEINFPNGITEIEGMAFTGCDSLTSVDLPQTMNFMSMSGLGFKANGDKVEGFTVKGPKNSPVHDYAIEHSFRFVAKAAYADAITLSTSAFTIEQGLSEQLYVNYTPSFTTVRSIKWTSSKPGVATVSNGKVTAVYPGTTVITAATSNGKTASCTVTVKRAPNPDNITLNISRTWIGVNEKIKLTPTITPENANNKTVSWSTSDGSVATVDSNGNVVGKKAGTATITAKTANGKTAKATIYVQPPATGITIDPKSLVIRVGQSYQLKSHVDAGTASYKRGWTSSDNSICYTSGSGLLTGKKVGIVTITVKTYNGVTCSIPVKVVN